MPPMLNLDNLRPPAELQWIDSSLIYWQPIIARFGLSRLPILNTVTGSILTDPSELHALQAMRSTGQEPPAGIVVSAAHDWFIPVEEVEIAAEDESLMAAILAGGIDRALYGRIDDESTTRLLLKTAERDLGLVPLLGMTYGQLDEILSVLAEPMPAAPRRADLPPAAFGIPSLDLAYQGEITGPARKWGSQRRTNQHTGLYHFYTADHTFTGLQKHPELLPASGCKSAIELNYSTGPAMPLIVGLYRIYQKRTIARLWQQAGVGIWVDMNLDRSLLEVNLLGVPPGWTAYANRARTGDHAHLYEAYELAAQRAAPNTPRYLVYGGGKRTAELCRRQQWQWMQEDAETTRSKPAIWDETTSAAI